MILVGLGSNRGDSAHALTGAMTEMESLAAGPYLRSSLWQTSPVDCPPGSGDFLNAVVAFPGRPTLTPELLLYRLKGIERRYGRGPVLVRNAPRELDLDLLIFDDELRDSDAFVLPHPRAIDRRFVLAPAAEVAPALLWPGTGRTVRELLATLDSAEQVRRAVAGPEGSVCPVAAA